MARWAVRIPDPAGTRGRTVPLRDLQPGSLALFPVTILLATFALVPLLLSSHEVSIQRLRKTRRTRDGLQQLVTLGLEFRDHATKVS